MMRPDRFALVLVAVAALAACSESTPTSVATDAALARGSGNGTASGGSAAATGRVEIVLTRPANAVYRSAKGKAKFTAKAGERELQVEVENVPVGTVLTILVGTSSYSATADALGKARLNMNSALGQSVPMAVTGAAVTVTSAAGTVVSGGF